MGTPSTNQRFRLAVRLAQQGQRRQAAPVFAGIVTEDPRNEAAWLWLAACLDDPQRQRYCLKQVLNINPHNQRARKALTQLPTQTEKRSASIPHTGTALVSDAPERTGDQYIRSEPADSAPTRRNRTGLVVLLLVLLAAIAALIFFFQDEWQGFFDRRSGQPVLTDLAQALRDAPSGATITLSEGVFNISGALEIDKAVTLKGAGVDETEVVLFESGIAVQPGSALSLEDISIRYDGDAGADVIFSTGGEINLTACRVGGGRWDPQTQAGGRGLVIEGSSGVISRCEFVNNDLTGMEVRGETAPLIHENLIHQNRAGGIIVSGSAQPEIRSNIIRDNGDTGLVYYETAAGKAIKNEITANAHTGIAVRDQAAPLIVENTVAQNLEFGAEITGEAKPMLLSNIFRESGRAGIAYFNHAAGAAQDNDCSDNAMHGISVNDDAAPFLQENRCQRNAQVGIDYWGRSGGNAVNNETTDNGLQGIAVHELARPILENNISRRNNDSGIIFWGASGGEARNNECSDNRLNGISVHADAQPVIEKNMCSGNSLSGIAYYERAGGSASENHCADNAKNTIHIADEARPDLTQNQCSDN